MDQFPENEVIRINSNIFIHHLPHTSESYPNGIYRVYFNVGVQYFQIGIDRSEEEGAMFTAKMISKALDKFRNDKP